MPEATVGQLERPQLQRSPERASFMGRVKNLARHVMRLARRPVDVSARPGLATHTGEIKKPQQLIEIEADIAEANKINPERAKRISDECCAVRAIMSAAAHATGEKNLRAKPQEYNARLAQMDQPPPRDTREAHQELLDLYQDYADGKYLDPNEDGGESRLRKAMQRVNVKLIQPQHRKDLKELIKNGKQVMVIIDEFKGPKKIPHILHLGLNEKGEFISLSDVKEENDQGKKVFSTVPLPVLRKLTTFTVTPKT